MSSYQLPPYEEREPYVLYMPQEDIENVKEIDVRGVRFERVTQCKKLHSQNGYTCIVRHDKSGIEQEFGYWRCSECGAENFEGSDICMNCHARAVKA